MQNLAPAGFSVPHEPQASAMPARISGLDAAGQRQTEVVRRIYDRIAAGDFPAVLALMDRDIVALLEPESGGEVVAGVRYSASGRHSGLSISDLDEAERLLG
jgi:hypothetical protein